MNQENKGEKSFYSEGEELNKEIYELYNKLETQQQYKNLYKEFESIAKGITKTIDEGAGQKKYPGEIQHNIKNFFNARLKSLKENYKEDSEAQTIIGNKEKEINELISAKIKPLMEIPIKLQKQAQKAKWKNTPSKEVKSTTTIGLHRNTPPFGKGKGGVAARKA